jgi:hypothetical protein
MLFDKPFKSFKEKRRQHKIRINRHLAHNLVHNRHLADHLPALTAGLYATARQLPSGRGPFVCDTEMLYDKLSSWHRISDAGFPGYVEIDPEEMRSGYAHLAMPCAQEKN